MIIRLNKARQILSSERWIFLLFFICLFLLKITYLLVMGHGVSTSDTYSYFDFKLWGNLRLYTIPTIYIILRETFLILFFQIVLSSLAWSYLTKSIISFFSLTGGKRLLSCAIVFSLASTTPVFVNDFFLMSESLSLSFTLLLVAFSLKYLMNPTSRSMWLVVLFYSAWIYAKQAHVLVSVPSFLLLAALIIWQGKCINKKKQVLAICIMLVITILAIWQVRSSNQISSWNLFAVLAMRIAKDPIWMDYFFSNGLPKDFILLNSQGALDIGRSISEARTANWLDGKGLVTYVDFLLTNPTYTLFAPFFIPLLSSSSFLWSDTFPAALFYSYKYFTFNVPNLPDNFSIWWFETPREVIRNLAIFIILLLEGIYRHAIRTTSLGFDDKTLLKRKKLFLFSAGLFVWAMLSGAIQWHIAPGDPTRIFLEQAVMFKVSLIIFAFGVWLPGSQNANMNQKGEN